MRNYRASVVLSLRERGHQIVTIAPRAAGPTALRDEGDSYPQRPTSAKIMIVAANRPERALFSARLEVFMVAVVLSSRSFPLGVVN